MTVPSARTLGLAGLGVVLLVVLMMVLSDDGGGTDAVPQLRFDERATAPGGVPVVDVNLEALQRERLEIGGAQRNLFRFQLPPAESSSPSPVLPPGPPPGLPLGLPSARDIPVAGPAGPPPPPPIPINFIGLAGAPGPEGQVVFFSDGRGHVFFGKEGDIIEGRYRVLKVNPGSAELAYLDGRGRQTILLSGQ